MRKILLLSLIAYSCQMMGDTWSKGPNRIFIGPSYSHNHYTSIVVPGLNSNENQWGITGGYEYYRPCNLFFRIRALIDWGSAHGSVGNWVDQRQFGTGEIGYTFAVSKHWFITPYAGIGYFRDRIPTEGFPTSTEYSTYIPTGVLIGWDLNCEWNLKLRAQADLPVFHRVHLTGVNTALTKKTRWEFELPITYNPASFCWDLSLVPFFNRVPHSTTTSFPLGLGQATYEAVQINTWGARLEVGYDF